MNKLKILKPEEVFMKALETDNVNVLRTLLKTNTRIRVNKILVKVVINKDVNKFRKLLEAGVNPNIALRYASIFGNKEFIKISLKYGANPNYIDGNTTLLWTISFNGHLECLDILLEAGAKINMQNRYGDTALMGAVCEAYNHVNKSNLMTRALLNAGANPNIQNRYGWTVLMMASQDGYKEIVKLLLQAGANPNLKNKDGKTAMDVANVNTKKILNDYIIKIALLKNGKLPESLVREMYRY